MFKGLLSVAIIFGVSSASACLQVKPNYAYQLGGNISLQENGQTYTGCVVKGGYLTLKNSETFRLQGLIVECNERMLGHNSMYLQLKDGQISPNQGGFSGSYDMYNLFATYSATDQDGTYEETDIIEFAKKCDQVSLDVEIKKTGSVTYAAKISGVLTAKISR